MDNVLAELSQCAIALITLALGWVTPTPRALLRSLLKAVREGDRDP